MVLGFSRGFPPVLLPQIVCVQSLRCQCPSLSAVQGKKEKKGKKKKDPTADRSIESLFAELVSNGILQPCPHVHVRDYLGSSSFMQATLEKVGWVYRYMGASRVFN